MTDYSDATAIVVRWVKFWEEEVKNARSATENTNANALAYLAGNATLNPDEQASTLSVINQRIANQKAITAQMRASFQGPASKVARAIGSNTAQGSSITNWKRFFEDWRAYQDGAADEKVVFRAVTFASEPSASDNGNVKRLTVGIQGAGDRMECGRHATTAYCEVTSKPSPFRAISILKGPQGPQNALDVYAGPSSTQDMEHWNGLRTSGNVTNPNMNGTNTTTDNAAVTSINGWVLATTLGVPTFLINTTAAELWRERAMTGASQPFVFSLATASTTKTFTQRIPAGVMANRRVPILPYLPVRMTTGWEGTITIAWGSKSQAFTHSDLTAGAWVNLYVDRDADLYPEVFDTDDASYTITIATGAGASTNEVHFGFFDAPSGVMWNGNWYWVISNDDEPVIGGTLSFADTATAAGEIQDTICMAFEDENVGAYLMTAGTNTLADPA